MQQLLKWAAKLDSIGEFSRSDKLMRIAANIGRAHAREIATEIANQIRERHSDIVENSWATGSIAYESEKVIQSTETKDVDIFIEIKGNWNRLKKEQRTKFLEDLARMVADFGQEISFDFFMTDESKLLLNFSGWSLYHNFIENKQDFIDEDYVYYPTAIESERAADNQKFPILENITTEPVVHAPRKVAPIGWKMWGIHEDQDEPKSIYDIRSRRRPGWSYEDMGWRRADEQMLREHFTERYPGLRAWEHPHSVWFGENPSETAENIEKGARKLSKIYKIPQEEIERRIRNLMRRIGAYPAYWDE